MLVCNLNEVNKISFTVNMNGAERLNSSKVCFDIIVGEMRLSFDAIKDSLNSFEAIIPPMESLLEPGEFDCEIRILLGTRLFTPAKQRILFLTNDLDVLNTTVSPISINHENGLAGNSNDELDTNETPNEEDPYIDNEHGSDTHMESVKKTTKTDLLEQFNSVIKKKEKPVKEPKKIDLTGIKIDFTNSKTKTESSKIDFAEMDKMVLGTIKKKNTTSKKIKEFKTPNIEFKPVDIKKSGKMIIDNCDKSHTKKKSKTSKKKKLFKQKNENNIIINKSDKVEE